MNKEYLSVISFVALTNKIFRFEKLLFVVSSLSELRGDFRHLEITLIVSCAHK